MAELGKTEAKIEQMIQERRSKIQEFRRSVEVSRDNADREITASIQVFTKLKEAVERNQAEVIETTEEKHKTTEKQAEGFIKELEEEISELKKRSAELEQLSHSEDHLNLVQNCPSLNAPLPTKNWTEVRVCPPSYEGTGRAAFAQSMEMLQHEMKELPTERELKIFQQYAVDVTLDPETAHRQLILSEDGKQVHCGLERRNVPDNPKRFSDRICVLGKEMFSSGRFYFEVQVKGKTDWVLGVARESVDRKKVFSFNPRSGYWRIGLRNANVYCAFTESQFTLSLKSRPEKVGVFVDYEEGLVSFYDPDAGSLIYSYTGCYFRRNILPFFFPAVDQNGTNSAPLIICPVDH
ncbi:E3 ubiquitin-protein ligase TRIM39-like [Centropristis striata]|uniref:E3 ubiquitin-protein ligase TRIM39-like n=1 Tax=Centropristis striata TaxID=184440 RepID=UPI0027DED7EE|nr:E3 ubiquitin-protein ligase TRIM39-like [Centropristis striata]